MGSEGGRCEKDHVRAVGIDDDLIKQLLYKSYFCFSSNHAVLVKVLRGMSRHLNDFGLLWKMSASQKA